jgi:alpha-1,3-mannosyltransferase
MNVLLYLPGILMVLVEGGGLVKAVAHIAIMVLMQVTVGNPFLTTFPAAYLGNAFNFSRAFLYKWTVNWRFVEEDVFLSKAFARSLLVCHLLVLVAFGLRWCKPLGGFSLALRKVFWNVWERPSISRMGADSEPATNSFGAVIRH